MPRVKKSTSTPAQTPVTNDTAASPVKRSKTTKKTTKVSSDKVQATTATAVVAQETVEATNVATTESSPLSEITEVFSEFAGRLNQMTSQFTSLKNDFKALEKRTIRELKAAHKASLKKQRKNGNRQPSGFVKPTKISVELATFLGKEPGTEMARTEVTREINKYIRAHNLQDSENGRKINPDKSLRTLLKVPNDQVLTYFNLQRYMSPHFAKVSQTTSA